MRRITKMLFFGILLGSIMSCGEENGIELGSLDQDYLVFGHFYGECGGEGCIETFALTSNKLYEDTNDMYRGTDFNFVELENEIFEKVVDLKDKFPVDLLSEDEQTFGCPDCGDWGGILVQYVQSGNAKTWFIDLKTEDVPEYLNDFVDAITEKISLINN